MVTDFIKLTVLPEQHNCEQFQRVKIFRHVCEHDGQFPELGQQLHFAIRSDQLGGAKKCSYFRIPFHHCCYSGFPHCIKMDKKWAQRRRHEKQKISTQNVMILLTLALIISKFIYFTNLVEIKFIFDLNK